MPYYMIVLIALMVSAVGFIKFIFFISIGYGLSIAAIALGMLITLKSELNTLTFLLTGMLLVYGLRLGGFLLLRELRSASYGKVMKKEYKDSENKSLFVKCMIWIPCALLYSLQVSPVYFRIINHSAMDAMGWIGLGVMIAGVLLESFSDFQKSQAKKKNPKRFVDTGLFRIVRCPNYLGELIFWIGVFLSGVTALKGGLQWAMAVIALLAIIYIMFSGARRLEIRQNRTYGHDVVYQAYVTSVPILIPFIPLYSVEKYKWLIA